jgi:peptidoglycan hydrolase-like protein with peptidoglycan-binding domain
MYVFDSFNEVPLDHYVFDDGDDSQVPGEEGAVYAPPEVRLLALATPSNNVVVPFYGEIKRNNRGPRVKALKRALSEAGFMQWGEFTPLMGPFAVNALKNFQKAYKLQVDGVYGRVTHQKLAPFYDAYAIKYLLIAPKPKQTKEQKKRSDFFAQLMYLYNKRSGIGYTQRRAFDTWKPPRGLDCSASGEWAAKWAELGSLSGYSSYGYGNTDSQIYRYRRLGRQRSSVWKAELGDPVYYGYGGDPSHVAYWVGGGRVWSFGSYPIKILSWNYRSDVIGAFDLIG